MMKKMLVLMTIIATFGAISCKDSSNKSPADSQTPPVAEVAIDTSQVIDATGKWVETTAAAQYKVEAARANMRQDVKENIANINTKIEKTDKKIAADTREKKLAWAKEKKKLFDERAKLNAQATAAEEKAKLIIQQTNTRRAINQSMADIDLKIAETDKKIASETQEQQEIWAKQKKKMSADRDTLKVELKKLSIEPTVIDTSSIPK